MGAFSAIWSRLWRESPFPAGRQDIVTAGPDSGGTTWLTLVLGEAPAAAFEEHRRRLHADASPAARALVDTEARRALQVKALLTDRRHHSAELTVLNDLA